LNSHVTLSVSVVLDTSISNAEKAMLLILACYADAEGTCSVQQRTLAEHYGCSLRFARTLLTQLRAKGCLTWERRASQNVYRMLR
jgi:MarR-like DNA-binding transcriptional regulator SgrR of sgrS sRNA